MTRVLVVQCCHLPQFFYVVERLRERHPEWQLDALVVERPHVHPYLERFPSFHRVYSIPNRLPEASLGYAYIVFPLLNRGYRRIKHASRRLAGPSYEVDYQGNLRPLARSRLIRSFFFPLASPNMEFVQYLETFPHRPLGETILFVESCDASLVRLSEDALSRMIQPQAERVRVGRGSAWKAWKAARHKAYDSAVVFFSGEKGFALLKALPFLLRIPKILVVNENRHYFYASPRSLARFLYQRVRTGIDLPRPTPRILFFQTEAPRYITEAIRKLKQPALFPDCEITLVCREADRPLFQDLREIAAIRTYSRRSLRHNLRLWRELKKADPDLISAVFSGRPFFRKQKLFFFLFSARRRLVFNARLDCYSLTFRTFFRIFRKEPLLFEDSKGPVTILLIQTEEDLESGKAIEVLKNPKVAGEARISVFCGEEKRAFFQSLSGVQQVFSYRVGKPLETIKTLWKLARWRPDIVAAIFSGRPTFRKQKFLFFLLPARNRLVFNQNLDCFYLTKEGIRQAADLFGQTGPFLSVAKIFFRQVAKILLFLPRFLYLVSWISILKCRRIRLFSRR